MEREDDKKEQQPSQKLTAYIGLQNEPLGEEPNISISFGISLRLFCVVFAISRMEKERGKQTESKKLKDDDDDD